MDAANPRRRWACTLGLFAALTAGCQHCSDCKPKAKTSSTGAAPQVSTTRGQAPSDPVPGLPLPPTGPAPTMPTAPTTPVAPIEPTAPLPAAPAEKIAPPRGEVMPTPATGDASQAAFVMPPNSAAMKQFILNSKPQLKIVAIVGKGNIVTDDEVWQSVRQRPDHREALTAGDRDVREAEMYRAELKKIIERELLVDDMFGKMKKSKPGALDEIRDYAARTADRHLRDARRKNNIATEKEFEDRALIPQGLTVNVLRRQIERNTIAIEYVRSLVREQVKGIGLGDVHEYYVKHADKFQTKERVKWQDIFIAFAKFSTPQEAYRQAEEVRRKAAEGADFAALAKEHDHGDAAFRNGEGVGTTRGEIRPEELEPVIFQTNPGQISPLVQTATGYHIVKVVERQQAGTKPFDDKCQNEIREMLFDQMQKQIYNRLTEDLWRKGAVQVIDVP